MGGDECVCVYDRQREGKTARGEGEGHRDVCKSTIRYCLY